MWTVTLKMHEDIDGLVITRDLVFKFAKYEDALYMVEKMSSYMNICTGKYTLTIGCDTQEAQPVDWKE